MTGALGNIQDGLTQAIATGFKPMFDLIDEGAQSFAAFLSSATFERWTSEATTELQSVIAAVKSMFGAFKSGGGGSGGISGFFRQVATSAKDVWSFLTGSLIPSVVRLVETFGPPIASALATAGAMLLHLTAILRPLGVAISAVTGFLVAHKTVVLSLVAAVGSAIAVTKTITAVSKGWEAAQLAVKKAQQAYALATYTSAGATNVFAVAFRALKAAFLSNPIGIIVTALVALGVAFVEAYKHSETFRRIVHDALNGVVVAAKAVARFFTHDVPAAFRTPSTS
jgi:hypothetical protein